MFQEMKDAAYAGNVEYLKKIVAEKPPDYLVTLPDGDRNIFHFAVVAQKVEFLREAINILPRDVVKQLLLQPNLIREENMLGCAALYIDYELIKVIRELYESVSWSSQDEKPWLWLNRKKMNALHTVLREVVKKLFKEQEKCAMEILLTDPEFVNCTVVDNYGHTPLYYALKNGFNRVAEKILMAPLPANSIYSDNLENYTSPFSFATNNCSENVVRLLFKKFGKWLDKIDERGFTILHIWAEHGKDEPCKILLDGDDDVADGKTKIFKEMIFLKENKMADTPLHLAARKKESKLGEILIRGYQQQLNLVKEINQDDVAAAECPPWKIKNIRGNTPLHSSLYAKHEELALYILSIDPTLCQVFNNKNESPFFLSVMFGCPRVLDEILKIDEPRFKMLRRNDGTTVLHYLSALPEKTCPMLLNKYWWILNLKDNEEKTALDYAKRNDVPWLINMLSDPSVIEKEDFDWINACKREEVDAVLTFVDHCQNLQILCRDASDTPLHHIKLPTINAYRSFLENSSIADLKNNIDHDGATPLHRALQRKDMNFAKALLLDDEVQRTIKDNNGKTAMNLLATLCKENEDWAKMCKLINVDPNLNTKFLQQGTNLDQMRNTLSVVAALLATITFAAGFTLPGGINSDTGEAVLAKKVSFLVFLLADVYAMCTSILVLFCLIWSMVMDSNNPNVARVLIDRSMYILMQSLYATLLAFMTGIYTVIQHSSLWAAIVIFVMCSLIGIAVNKSILHWVISKLIPSISPEKQYQTPANEEEMEIIIAKDEEKTNK